MLTLKNCTNEIGMIIHPKKSTKNMSVNNTNMEPFILENICVCKTNKYNYVECLMKDEEVSYIVRAETKRRWRNAWKFYPF